MLTAQKYSDIACGENFIDVIMQLVPEQTKANGFS
jgi:hypothetical protein